MNKIKQQRPDLCPSFVGDKSFPKAFSVGVIRLSVLRVVLHESMCKIRIGNIIRQNAKPVLKEKHPFDYSPGTPSV